MSFFAEFTLSRVEGIKNDNHTMHPCFAVARESEARGPPPVRRHRGDAAGQEAASAGDQALAGE